LRSKYYARKPILKEDVFKKPRKHKKFPLFVAESLKLSPKIEKIPKQNFDYFLVLDFEATCDSPTNIDPQEIIEFPVLKVNGETFKTESTFHSYVKPEIYPELSSFCSELTGIIQGMIDNQPVFKTVFQNFLDWMRKENLTSEVKIAFVTCGDMDLDYLLPLQCRISGIEVPDYMHCWINIKRSFCEIRPYTWPDNLSKMLEHCELEPEGELHSGLDDSKNIARVLEDLAKRGLVFDFNGWKKT